jgi:hypothetical protein
MAMSARVKLVSREMFHVKVLSGSGVLEGFGVALDGRRQFIELRTASVLHGLQVLEALVDDNPASLPRQPSVLHEPLEISFGEVLGLHVGDARLAVRREGDEADLDSSISCSVRRGSSGFVPTVNFFGM